MFKEHIERSIRTHIESVKKSLVAGTAEDYAGYREAVGQLRGLEEALSIALDTVSKLVDEEDFDD